MYTADSLPRAHYVDRHSWREYLRTRERIGSTGKAYALQSAEF
jgi:hypothetical protein